MTTVIKLDTKAMNALFPEGSEARVDLQAAVIKNFINRNADNFLSEKIEQTVKEHLIATVGPANVDILSEAANYALRKYIDSHWHGLKLSGKGQLLIIDEVKQVAAKHIEKLVRDTANEMLSDGVEQAVLHAKKIMPDFINETAKSAWKYEVLKQVKKSLGDEE